MNKTAEWFGALTREQASRMMSIAVERDLPAGTELLRESELVQAVHFVSEGLLHVHTGTRRDRPVAVLGHGEIVGEMSFIDPDTAKASASVVAVEDSRILSLPHVAMKAMLADDSDFAARVYRSMAIISARRLRHTLGHLADVPLREGDSPAHRLIRDVVEQFKAAVLQYEGAALRGDQVAVDALEVGIRRAFLDFLPVLNDTIGADSPLGDLACSEIGRLVHREFMPYLSTTLVADRMYAKPRGYAGDFFTIEMIYRDAAGGSGRIGPLLDRCFLDAPAAVAVRNRRALLCEEIGSTVAAAQGRPVQITSLACGPARELFDVLASDVASDGLCAHLVDMDLKALAFVGDLAAERGLSDQMRTHSANLIYLAVGRENLDIPPQDLIYSIGLIDYFPDDLVVKLLDWIHGQLRPGGRVVLGNFHPANPSRAMMDHVLEWRLIHRSEADMHGLYQRSAFGRGCTNIRYEAQGINLFAECIRA